MNRSDDIAHHLRQEAIRDDAQRVLLPLLAGLNPGWLDAPLTAEYRTRQCCWAACLAHSKTSERPERLAPYQTPARLCCQLRFQRLPTPPDIAPFQHRRYWCYHQPVAIL